MPAADAFFLADGDAYVATPLTRGPWSDVHQHGGPPAALLARSMEALVAAEPGDWQFVRFTVDFLRPLVIGPAMRVAAEVSRRSNKVLGLSATLTAGDKPLARATALCIRGLALALPREAAPADRPRDPDSLPVHTFPFFRWDVGYHTAVDARRGEHGSVWLRPRHPLLVDEPLSPLARTLIAADAVNGVGFVLDIARYSFINADLTIHLHRLPAGLWVQLAATHATQPNGVGLVDAALADVRGPIGRALESQVVATYG